MRSLWDALGAAGRALRNSLIGRNTRAAVADILEGSLFGGQLEELRGRSVLLSTAEQLTSALALIELDGLAGRIVLYPPGLPAEHLSYVIKAARVDVVVSDQQLSHAAAGIRYVTAHGSVVAGELGPRGIEQETEWVLLTSGTTGLPKLVVHTLATLTSAFAHAGAEPNVVWSTFYDIRRYGGLQIFLRAALSGTSFVLSSAEESTSEFLARACASRVTHISGTPSHWRRALMDPAAQQLQPVYIRLSGEMADQALLDQLQAAYPGARISHAFASTEAGVGFEVEDGFAGVPRQIFNSAADPALKIENGSLRIRSSRTAIRYLGENPPALRDAEGFVDTCDLLALVEDRYQFVGRRDGVINVGGFKVHPEEVEAIINRHPDVQASLVRPKKNPILGSLVVADLVLQPGSLSANKSAGEVQQDVLNLCRSSLPSYKVPAAICVVRSLPLAPSGKVRRGDA